MLATGLPAPTLKWKSANPLIDGMHDFLGASVSKAIRLPGPWGYKPANAHKPVRTARMQRATQLLHLHVRREQDVKNREKKGEKKLGSVNVAET